MSAKRPRADEAELWEWATRDAKPLRARRARVPAPKPRVEPKPVPHAAASASPVVRAPVLSELSHGTSPGVDRRTAERLHRGQMEIDGRIDLHGMTQSEAHDALAAFMDKAEGRGWRCVLVITGKGTRGGGVLRAAVPRWLNLPPHRARILSFGAARPKDGGDGALYVLLRRRRMP
ncbi:MAG: Smr/MutS family protein [Alphaproteobacteria bacterium]|nr:Smr/MutS family protein [Alphaproteobacteria bacterium]